MLTSDPTRALDAIGRAVLAELQRDARVSWSELGRRVGLSAPAVAERVRRLEDAGVVRGYRVDVDPACLGRGLRAFVRVRVVDGDRYEEAQEAIAALDVVLECHRITGEDCLLLQVAVATMRDLELLLERLVHFGPTTTSMVLSTVVPARVVL